MTDIEAVASECSWISLYYDVIADEINKQNYSSCLEIGVAYGFHAMNILSKTKAKYIGIDPYLAGYDDTDIFSQDLARRLHLPPQDAMDTLYKHVQQKLAAFNNRAHLIRATSEAGLNKIDDSSIDIIFVDGNHQYNYVLTDLRKSWVKLRPGGCLCGDDFNLKEVERAVTDFSKEIKVDFAIRHKPGQNYPIFFFTKPFISAGYPTYSLPDSKGRPIDHKLIEIMKCRRNGVFIEAGANDGITQSNTKLLEDQFGWNGLLIEPSPNLLPALKKNRAQCKIEHTALVSDDYKGSTITGDFDGHLMSSVNGSRRNKNPSITIPATTLGSLLKKHDMKHIDLFSLDVEGYELEVLRGIDFDAVSFSYLLIEVYEKDKDLIITFLASKGYKLHSNFSGYNKQDNPIWDGTHNDYLFVSQKIV